MKSWPLTILLLLSTYHSLHACEQKEESYWGLLYNFIFPFSTTIEPSAQDKQLLIGLGARYHHALETDDQPEITTIEEDQSEAVRALAWFYTDIAQKKHAQKENAENILPLREFTMRINTSASAKILDAISRAPGAYKRPSTHFLDYYKHYQTTHLAGTHRGLDLAGLPVSKRTILFGAVDDDKNMFMKLENYGLGYPDIILHTKEAAESFLRKRMPWISSLITYYAPPLKPITDICEGHLKTDDEPDMAKERVPQEHLAEYDDILKELAESNLITSERAHELRIAAKQIGIHHMRKSSQELVETIPNDEPSAIDTTNEWMRERTKEFLEKLFREFQDIEGRLGREIIITQADCEKHHLYPKKGPLARAF